LRALPLHEDPLWWDDLHKRFADGVPGTQDAFALVSDGGLILGCASISKRHDVGVLTRLFVQADHRRQGLARALTETLLSWFDMTGGKWLYGTTTTELAETLFGGLGFSVLHRAPREPHDAVVLVRRADDVPPDPLLTADGAFSIHDVTRANWPTLATLLYNRAGPDPRASLDESAVAAERSTLELLAQQEAGTCQLKAAFHGARLVALASVALDAPGDRTYAVIMPHDDAPEKLRDTVIQFARGRGYANVDFPMEALAPRRPVRRPGPPVSAQEKAAAPSAETVDASAPPAETTETPELPAEPEPVTPPAAVEGEQRG
jgi:GNAT superfamily N-acetyltransferase